MTTIKQIFDEISAEPGSNKKMEILASYKSFPDLQDVLYAANSKRVKFYIKQIPNFTKKNTIFNLDAALISLTALSKREKTGDEASKYLADILSSVSSDDAYIIERIIEKDCKLGMGTTNINKIFPGLIEDTPYMGAKPFSEKLIKAVFLDSANRGFAYSQVKMDGRYSNAIIRSGDVELESRSGEPTFFNGAKFTNELKQFENCVLNGELTIAGVSRYISNGIIASIVSIGNKMQAGDDTNEECIKFEKKNNISYHDALDKIQFTVWDTITIDEYFDQKSLTPYINRLINLSALINSVEPTMVSFIETSEVYNYEQAMEHFQKNVNMGQEGTILKASNGLWKDGKPNWQIKIKIEMDVDLKIIGFNYGTGKNEKVISSINAQSSDGKVNTKPTGISEDMMDYITKNQDKLMGMIVEVKCSGLSHDSNGNYSLLHPVFKKIRDDKNTCDSLEDIKNIEAAAKGLKNS